MKIVSHRGSRGAISLVLAGMVALAAFVADVSPCRADPAEVESLIAQGNDLRRQGHDQQALPYFQKAYRLLQTPRTEGQLGLCEQASGYPVEAEKHLVEALESPEHPWIAKYRTQLEQDLALARRQIGDVTIEGTPPGASILVNGAAAGTLPLSAPMRVAAGKTGIEVRAPGYAAATRSIHVSAGEHQRITINLESEAATAQADKPGPTITGPQAGGGSSADTSAPTSPKRIAAWTAAGAAAIGLGLGLGFQAAASGKLSDFNKGCFQVPGSDRAVADQSSSLTDAACTNMLSDWNSEKRWAIVGYVATGALAVTSAFLFWSSRESTPALRAQARFTCAPGIAAVSCGGVF